MVFIRDGIKRVTRLEFFTGFLMMGYPREDAHTNIATCGTHLCSSSLTRSINASNPNNVRSFCASASLIWSNRWWVENGVSGIFFDAWLLSFNDTDRRRSNSGPMAIKIIERKNQKTLLEPIFHVGGRTLEPNLSLLASPTYSISSDAL